MLIVRNKRNLSVIKAVCHFPSYDGMVNNLAVYEVSERFCTFSCCWDNKPLIDKEKKLEVEGDNNYCHIDISGVFLDKRTGKICSSDGIIICPKEKGVKPIVIYTGDSCAYPQILEVNYK